MIYIFLYVFGILILWYENKCIVLDVFERPPIFQVSFQPIWWIGRIILLYGSIIGIWYVYGIPVAVVALVIKIIISQITFKHYFRKQVVMWMPHFYKILCEEAEKRGQPFNENQTRFEAIEMSKKQVYKAIKGEL